MTRGDRRGLFHPWVHGPGLDAASSIADHRTANYTFAMARADRFARLDVRRAELEAEYVDALIAALRTTASGKWGLFDHNGDRGARAAVATVVADLNEIGDAIDGARQQLGMPPYELHEHFLASRGPVGPQAVGEPRQAQAWLDRLVETKTANA